MAINMRIEVTSGVQATDVPDDVAVDLQDAYDALKSLPVNRMATTDPFTSEGYTGPAKVKGVAVTETEKAAFMARRFVKQGKAWAAAQEVVVPILSEDGESTIGSRKSPLVFARKGDIKGNPTVVSFRLYVPRAGEDDTDAGE
jgi:hypothetical protein